MTVSEATDMRDDRFVSQVRSATRLRIAAAICNVPPRDLFDRSTPKDTGNMVIPLSLLSRDSAAVVGKQSTANEPRFMMRMLFLHTLSRL